MKKRLKSISRIDSDRAKGWYVRVAARKRLHAKFFSDSRYGGRKKEALRAAIAWRDQTEESLGKPHTERTVVLRPNKRRAGVRRTKKAGAPVYEVTWSPRPGKTNRTTFSIRLYGERGARDLAYTWRAAMERKYYGYR